MKKLLLFLITLTAIHSYSQETEYTFGEITANDLNFKIKEIDSTANAVVLYESGNSSFTTDERYVIIKTNYYFKIKIMNKEGFKHATFSIPIYNTKSNYEKVIDIKGITHNNNNTTKTHLSLNNVYTEKENEHWKFVKFTMPNIQDESIIEVSYTVVTPFKFNLTGWEFQSEIPKLISQYKASIPGNYFYNRSLVGFLKLTTNNSEIKKHCFRVPGVAGDANCEEVIYRMENIPAFIDEEYMTSNKNFMSKIKFELAESTWFDGTKKKYTTTWEAVDNEFRTDKNIGTQLRKINYFEDIIPQEFKNIPDSLDRAKAVYTFIQNHFTWNKKYGIFKDARVKDAFKEKTGNVSEINISLINALKTAGLNTELVLISTRNNGVPTKLYPVITDFNYVLAKVNIGNKYYLLDATQKLNPFGLLPFECLNNYGRAMDFKNESYWVDIKSYDRNKTNYYAKLILNSNGTINGQLRKVTTGYTALDKRKEYINKSEDLRMSEFEDSFTNCTVTNYKIENENNIDKPLIETYELTFNFENTDLIYLNPFFGGSIKTNPFKQEDRIYPVDFGYNPKQQLNFSLELPENYQIESTLDNQTVNLEENAAIFNFRCQKGNPYKLTIYSYFNINKSVFYNNEYNALKKIYNATINAQKTPIVIRKINI